MSASSYGIIVEGDYDSAVYDAIIRRLTSPGIHIRPLPCQGKTNLMRKFPGLLRRFEYEIDGNPVDMAIVIRDADGRDASEVEAKMRTKIQNSNYPFRLSVRFFAVPQAMDAWLLADVAAISAAVQGRGGKRVARSHDDPESLLDPKGWLRKLLTDHQAAYTAELCREIAQKTDLQLLSQRCRSFPVFAELVDC
ncbi:MAG: DUF4276 family protein [Candidatus Sulfotelmatobacter sp.]